MGQLAADGEQRRDGGSRRAREIPSSPGRPRCPRRIATDEPEQIELPPPRRTLLQRLALWVQHAHALKGWVEQARGRSPALDATFETIERDSHIGGAMLAGALAYRLFASSCRSRLRRLRPRAAGKHGRLRAEGDHQLGRAGRGRHQAGRQHQQGRLELVGRPRLVLRARLLGRPAPGRQDRPLPGLETLSRLVKVHRRPLRVFGAALAGQLLLVAGVGAVNHQTVIGGLVTLAVFVFALAGIWLIVSLQLPHGDAGWTDLIPGSLFYAVGLTGVALFNILILGRLIQEKTTTYGALGAAATYLLAFFFIRARDRRRRRPQRHPLRAPHTLHTADTPTDTVFFKKKKKKKKGEKKKGRAGEQQRGEREECEDRHANAQPVDSALLVLVHDRLGRPRGDVRGRECGLEVDVGREWDAAGEARLSLDGDPVGDGGVVLDVCEERGGQRGR